MSAPQNDQPGQFVCVDHLTEECSIQLDCLFLMLTWWKNYLESHSNLSSSKVSIHLFHLIFILFTLYVKNGKNNRAHLILHCFGEVKVSWVEWCHIYVAFPPKASLNSFKFEIRSLCKRRSEPIKKVRYSSSLFSLPGNPFRPLKLNDEVALFKSHHPANKRVARSPINFYTSLLLLSGWIWARLYMNCIAAEFIINMTFHAWYIVCSLV